MWQKFKKTKVYSNWATLLKALKPMTWKQRIEHLWEYHKYQLVVLFLIVFTLGITVTALQSRNKEVLAGGMIVNVYMEPDGYQYLTGDYEKELGGDGKKKIVELFPIYFGDPMDLQYGEEYYNASMVLTARVSGRMLDYMLLDQFALEYYMPYGAYMNLEKLFTQEELDALDEQGLLRYVFDEIEEVQYPIAICVTDTQFAKDNITVESDVKDVYLAFAVSTPKQDICLDVWERILAWK